VELDVPANPVDVGLLRAAAVVPDAQNLDYAVVTAGSSGSRPKGDQRWRVPGGIADVHLGTQDFFRIRPVDERKSKHGKTATSQTLTSHPATAATGGPAGECSGAGLRIGLPIGNGGVDGHAARLNVPSVTGKRQEEGDGHQVRNTCDTWPGNAAASSLSIAHLHHIRRWSASSPVCKKCRRSQGMTTAAPRRAEDPLGEWLSVATGGRVRPAWPLRRESKTNKSGPWQT
jgi:hypothetical protein